MIFRCIDALVTLAEPRNEELIQFYTQLLGQEPHPHIPNVYAEFHFPGLRLGIFKPKESQVQEFVADSKSSISLCLEVTDLEEAIAHLTAIGNAPTGEILTASHGREIYVYGPAGNRLILHQSFDTLRPEGTEILKILQP